MTRNQNTSGIVLIVVVVLCLVGTYVARLNTLRTPVTMTLQVENRYEGLVRVVESRRERPSWGESGGKTIVRVDEGGFAYVRDLDDVFSRPYILGAVDRDGRKVEIRALGSVSETGGGGSVRLVAFWVGSSADEKEVSKLFWQSSGDEMMQKEFGRGLLRGAATKPVAEEPFDGPTSRREVLNRP